MNWRLLLLSYAAQSATHFSDIENIEGSSQKMLTFLFVQMRINVFFSFRLNFFLHLFKELVN